MTFGQDEISTLNARIWEQGVQIDRLKAELASACEELAEAKRQYLECDDWLVAACEELAEAKRQYLECDDWLVAARAELAAERALAAVRPARPAADREAIGRVIADAWAARSTDGARQASPTWGAMCEDSREVYRRIADAVLAAARPGKAEFHPLFGEAAESL